MHDPAPRLIELYVTIMTVLFSGAFVNWLLAGVRGQLALLD